MENVDTSNIVLFNSSTSDTSSNIEVIENSQNQSKEKAKGRKRERLSFKEEQDELTSVSSYECESESAESTSKKVKSLSNESSEGSSFYVEKNQDKRYHSRNYRPKMIESSSDDDSNEPNTKNQSVNIDTSDSCLSPMPPSHPISVGSSNDEAVSSSGNSANPVTSAQSQNETDSDSDEDTNEAQQRNLASDNQQQRNEARAKEKAKLKKKVNMQTKKLLEMKTPPHAWNSVVEVMKRQYGSSCNKQAHSLFRDRYSDSLHVAQRLELLIKLDYHQGCVNALGFNSTGELLASSSDDLQIAVWNWTTQKTCITYNSGHRNNVFQCKFLPLSGNTLIASCARDGQVRLAELTPSGVCKDTRRLAKHKESAHKLTARTNSPYEIMSAGEDAIVYNIDIRKDQPEKIVLVKTTSGKKVPLHSIDSHPLNDNQFCVSGKDEYVRVYDRRIMSPFGPPVIKYCPNHLVDSKPLPNITSAVYSNNGDAILASYNNEDIYLFDTNLSEGAEFIHRYSGHLNSMTIKGVNFFSPSSQYVISGSDCGNIFIWDRNTEAIVNVLLGDEKGAVNVLEPHPHLPILATSGLDSDVKLWTPSSEKIPDFSSLPQLLKSNLRQKLEEYGDDFESLPSAAFDSDSQILMLLYHHARRSRMFPSGGAEASRAMDDEFDIGESSDSTAEYNSDDSDTHDDGLQCSTQ